MIQKEGEVKLEWKQDVNSGNWYCRASTVINNLKITSQATISKAEMDSYTTINLKSHIEENVLHMLDIEKQKLIAESINKNNLWDVLSKL